MRLIRKPTTRLGTIAIDSALVAASLTVALLVCEASLALFHPSKVVARPFFHIQSFFCQYDPVFGWRNKPGYDDIVRIDSNTSFHVRHNAKGFRDDDHPYEKAAGKTRVLALGDSFAWGFGLIYGAGRFSEYMMQFTGK